MHLVDGEVLFDANSDSAGTVLARYVLAGITLLVNSTVIVVVSLSRQLHVPRHTFWVGISVVIEFCSLGLVAETFISNRTVCAMHQLSMGLWYPSLLLFLSLAGWDRYAAIKHYEWYKKRMTNKRAIVAMVSAWLLNALVTEAPYWTGYKSLFECSANAFHVHCLFLWDLLLAFSNVALQVKLFIESHQAIRDYAKCGQQRSIRFVLRTAQSSVYCVDSRLVGQ